MGKYLNVVYKRENQIRGRDGGGTIGLFLGKFPLRSSTEEDKLEN